MNNNCPLFKYKDKTAQRLINLSFEKLRNNGKKMNLIWLEATGCSGNIISLMNAKNPDLQYFIKQMINLTYNNSLMAQEGENAFQKFIDTLDTEFILIVEGAVSTKNNGIYTIVARFQNKLISAMDAVKLAGEKAKYIISVGTCASFGGPSAASPNPSDSLSVGDFLKKEIIKVPGCPSHPDWVIGTIAHLIAFGMPELDSKGRPIMFYGITIHDRCTRRSFFDEGVFAKKLGDKECMFKLGCRGPVTKTDCPIRHWNGYINWPIEDNTPCIGCAQENFPDGMEPFIRF